MPKIAIITAHKYLPCHKKQRLAAMDWGVKEVLLDAGALHKVDVSPIWFDDMRKVKTTSWSNYTTDRNDILSSMQIYSHPHTEVFFYSPMCVGLSLQHAKETIGVIQASGASMYIHAGCDMRDFDAIYHKQKRLAETNIQRGKSNA